ncbi:MAG: 1,2-phenylacetyl-CoA epoxidase subunit PaaD [Actinomycetes bacterium]
MPTTTRPDLDAVRAAVGGVPDPELPPVTLGMLGMVHDVRVDDDGRVEVELLPTFSGCPATDMMGRDVEAAVREVDGVTAVTVRWRLSPAWHSDRISDEGHARLREFGIAPPTGGGPVSTVRPEGRPSLPLVVGGRDADAAPADVVACPWCGSDATVQDSPFGPTPCRAVHHCSTCDQPFERFKDL